MVLALIPRSTRSSRILSRSLRFAVIAASFGSAPPTWRAGEGSGWLAPCETYETDSKTASPAHQTHQTPITSCEAMLPRSGLVQHQLCKPRGARLDAAIGPSSSCTLYPHGPKRSERLSAG